MKSLGINHGVQDAAKSQGTARTSQWSHTATQNLVRTHVGITRQQSGCEGTDTTQSTDALKTSNLVTGN